MKGYRAVRYVMLHGLSPLGRNRSMFNAMACESQFNLFLGCS